MHTVTTDPMHAPLEEKRNSMNNVITLINTDSQEKGHHEGKCKAVQTNHWDHNEETTDYKWFYATCIDQVPQKITITNQKQPMKDIKLTGLGWEHDLSVRHE